MKTERLQAITDGIIAIIATIMVLELEIPIHNSIEELEEQWPVFLAYFNSFFMVYIMWCNHNREFSKVEFVNSKIFIVNGVWLFFVSLIPFANGWVGVDPTFSIPEFLYTLLLIVCIVLYQLLYWFLMKENPEMEKSFKRSNRMLVPVYLGLILALAFTFFMPILTLFTIFFILLLRIYQIWTFDEK